MSDRPILGQRVLYCLSKQDAEYIEARRAREGSGGNSVREGDFCAADVVRTFPGNTDGRANLKVQLDGHDTHWATSAPYGDGPGTWQRTAF